MRDRATKAPVSSCYKHSPRVKPAPNPFTAELHEFEMTKWRETFDSMGGLSRAGKQDIKVVDTLRKAPYHCPSLARRFDAHFGKLSRVSLTAKEVKKLPDKKDAKRSACNNIPISHMPVVRVMKQPKSWISRPPDETNVTVHELPVTCVLVKWGVGTSPSRFTCESLCEWLSGFGHVLFTIPEGDHSLFAAFDSIMSAYSVTWCHPKFSNFGQLQPMKNYKLSADPKWRSLLLKTQPKAERKSGARPQAQEEKKN
ncbi:uncharacterized protein LOC101863753 [Aplysia californica]|uniref:Uncharacterized protein LOC101863753 n=1 Tax=Aplysia californica TaxID=6500 RepID=A0ABM1VVX6_APLCA|nr:uncharacterized protein LOC101863753 [Aplysia californica]